MSDIIAAISGLKGAMDIAKSLVGVRDQTVLQSQLIDLQQKILDAQASTTSARAEQDALQEQCRLLQRRIDELEDWNVESAGYSLRAVAPGVLVYAPNDSGVAHFLCPTCFNSKQKSIIQKTQATRHGEFYIHRCFKCSTEFEFEKRPWAGDSGTYNSDYDIYPDLD